MGLPNMGLSRCVRITAVMNHAPFEFQVTIIFMLDRSPWGRGDFSGGSLPRMGLPPVVYICTKARKEVCVGAQPSVEDEMEWKISVHINNKR